MSAPQPSEQTLTFVVAVARNGVIGLDGGMPWHLPEELQHFKRVTMGGTLLMGRATYDAIGRPLPGRRTIVLTRDPTWRRDGVEVASGIDAALELAGPGEVFVVGGAQLFEALLPRADALVLTEVHAEPEGDTWFPAWERADWVETEREDHDGWSRARWVRRSLLGQPV